ncbi:hypothetical protein DRE_03522 [Drechslerella stenobrocha 248]|uniref:Rhodopsin domain-containing protein n=1 Tax=Drechslerella stenobrocha 248 TaxID=1043628 RepID=W7I4R6_9PEZI|nr:hypothetical protein DRE_03522 [Drechslerella stenobrocha 248]
MLLPPPSVMLSWPRPNYVDPDRQGNFMIPITIVLMVICAIVVALRLYVRAIILKAFKADDWLIIAATVTAMGVSMTCILSQPAGVGTHIWDLKQEQVNMVRIWSFATQLTFTWSVSLTKFSILLFYLRFCTTRAFKYWIYSTLTFLAAWLIIWTFLVTFQCVPVSAYWRLPKEGDRCIPFQNELHLLHGSTNLVTDVLVLLLPVPTLWTLHMPTRQKLMLVGVFALGIVAPLSAILRLIYIEKATVSWDASWWCFELWIYTSLETHVGIICASIPSLKPLAVKIFPRFGSYRGYSNSSPMELNGSSFTEMRRAQTGNSNISKAERAAKMMSIYPLTTIGGGSERGESQESIVPTTGSSDQEVDVITSFSSSNTPPVVPPKGETTVEVTEISRNSTMWSPNSGRYGSDRNV